MSEEAIVQILTLIFGFIVTIVTLLLRFEVSRLKKEIEAARQTTASTHSLLSKLLDDIGDKVVIGYATRREGTDKKETSGPIHPRRNLSYLPDDETP